MWKLFNIFVAKKLLESDNDIIKFIARDSDETKGNLFDNNINNYIIFTTGGLTLIYAGLTFVYGKYLPGTYTGAIAFIASFAVAFFVHYNLTAAFRVKIVKKMKLLIPGYEHFETVDHRVLHDAILKAAQLKVSDREFYPLVHGLFDKDQSDTKALIEESTKRAEELKNG
jgi:hypothetical protein